MLYTIFKKRLLTSILKNASQAYSIKPKPKPFLRGHYRNGYEEEELEEKPILTDLVKGQLMHLGSTISSIRDTTEITSNNINASCVSVTHVNFNLRASVEDIKHKSEQCQREIDHENFLDSSALSGLRNSVKHLSDISKETKSILTDIKNGDTDNKAIFKKLCHIHGYAEMVIKSIDEACTEGISNEINIREPGGALKQEYKDDFLKLRQKKDKANVNSSFYAQRELWMKKRKTTREFKIK